MQTFRNRTPRTGCRRAIGLLAFAVAPMCWATSLLAQTLDPVGAVHSTRTATDSELPRAQIQDVHSGADMPTRLILGLAGTLGGVYAGGAVGAQAAAGCHGEWCGFGSVLTGAAVGAVVVSAITAGMPNGSGKCGRTKRIATSLLGSGTGLVVGGVAGLVAGPMGVVLGALSGSSIGSATGASLCE
jgi:hypothetical protein